MTTNDETKTKTIPPPPPPELGFALQSDSGREVVAYYLSEALDVPIVVFEQMLERGDFVAIDMCVWVAASINNPEIFEDDVVAERVRAVVRKLTGWVG
jgi:hypothetical protein